MKKLSLYILSIILTTSLFSFPQDFQTAKKVAENFLESRSREKQFSAHFVLEENNRVLCYIFNYEPETFIAVTADNDIFPIIAYSLQNKFFQKESIIAEFLIHDISSKLDFYRNNPESAAINHLKWEQYLEGNITARDFQQWPAAGTTETGGWVETNWDQYAPYNNFCPLDDLDERCKVGCVANAMCQIINFHEYIGTPFFDDDDDYDAGDGIDIDDDHDTRDFPSFPELNDYLDTLATRYENGDSLTDNDIAALNFAGAVTCEMQFSSTGSGSSTGFVDNALTEKFDYLYAQYFYEETSDFYEKLKQNMIHRKPAQLSIWRSYRGGHSIVCDGYNTDDYYHLNMGWATTDSTFWFYLPDSLPNNYESIVGAVLDITPQSLEFRSVTSGNWYDPDVWEVYENGSWIPATSLPTSFSQTITIRDGDEVTVSQNVRADEIIVNSGGQLNIAENMILYLNNGAGTDLEVYGIIKKSGSITRSSGATISIKDGGIYRHNTDLSVSTATWESDSTCEIIGVGEGTSYLTLENVDQEFYHFAWNCPSQARNVGFLGNLTHLNGDFQIIDSNQKDVRLVHDYNTEIIVEGNIEISGGVLELTNGDGDCDLFCYGDFNLSDGIVRLKSGSSGSVWACGVLICHGNYIQTGGEISQDGTGNGEGRLRFEGAEGSYFSHSGGTFDPENIAVRSTEDSRYLTLQTDINIGSNLFTVFGTLDCENYSIIGSGEFDLRSSGVFKTSNQNGINGSVQVSGTKTFNADADYEFSGNYAQITGTYLPTEITDGLFIENSTGVTLSQNTTISSGNSGLNLIDGKLFTTDSTLFTFAPDGDWTATSDSSFISGPVKKISNSTDSFKFPTGKDSIFAPLEIIPESSSEATFQAEYFSETFGDLTTCNDSLTNISSVEYWNLDRISGNADAKVRLYWNEYSFEEIPDSLVVCRWNDSCWENAGQYEIDFENWWITSETVSEFCPFTFGEILLEIPRPENVQISVSDSVVTIQWNEVPEATSYKIYSSENPYSEVWDLEQSGITDTIWSESISGLKKFYYVTGNN